MNKIKIPVIVIVAAVGIWAAYAVISGTRERFASAYWRRELAAAPDDEVENTIRKIAESDAAGIEILVEALDSDREVVARAAKQELFARLAHWLTFADGKYAMRLKGLAEALAGGVVVFGPDGQKDAADVAELILLKLPTDGGDARQKTVAACAKVLRIALSAKGESGRVKRDSPIFVGTKIGTVPSPALLSMDGVGKARELSGSDKRWHDQWHTFGEQVFLDSESGRQAEWAGETIADLTPLNGEGSAGKSLSRPIGSENDEAAADSLFNRPGILGRPGKTQYQATRIPDNNQAGLQTDRKSIKENSSDDPAPIRPTSHFGTRSDIRLPDDSLAGKEAVELLRELNSADESESDKSEAELIRRGFIGKQLDLARKLYDPDPAVRKKLVEELPNAQGVDSVPWLLELCRDAEAEVRLAAITLLATSSDPAVLDEVERIAGRDRDEGVRRIGDRVAQQRNLRRQ
jgi:hypothetical protein